VDEDLKATPKEPAIDLKGRRVLVVDDNQTNILSICGLLIQWGMMPTSCPSAEVALMYVRSGYTFDVALIDICMPKISGVELARKINTIQTHMPLIALSSINVMDVDNMYFYKVLPKPIGEQKLYRVISELFVGKEMIRQPSDISLESLSDKEDKFNILVAEDIETNRRVIMGMLKRLGYNDITVVVNGDHAVKQVMDGDFQLILMDLKMPVMGGYEASKIITKRLGNDRPPIIALTAIAMTGDKENYLHKGYMDEYITKPIDINELGAKIKQFRR